MTSTEFKLYSHQLEAVRKLHSGAVLAGKVGSGKTMTALQFYKERYMNDMDLIVVTTAKKRNDGDWSKEAKIVGTKEPFVESWENIDKVVNKRGFFIFDEQHVSGKGKWVRRFLKIVKTNKWILLSGTPGDNWTDFIPLFIANKLVKDRTEFNQEYVVFNPHTKFPQILRYRNIHKLEAMRHAIVVKMPDKRNTVRKRFTVKTDYDRFLYDQVKVERINPYTKMPIKNASEYAQVQRKIVSTSPARILEFKDLVEDFERVIVFYNYNFELDIILDQLKDDGRNIYVYNRKQHDPTPTSKSEGWVYVVQYTAAEAWNNTSTNAMIFYSPNYSYKKLEQAEGRIDRINTPFKELQYYTLVSDAPIDKAVIKANKEKKVFNAAIWSE